MAQEIAAVTTAGTMSGGARAITGFIAGLQCAGQRDLRIWHDEGEIIVAAVP